MKNIEDDMEIYIKLAADLRSDDNLDDNNIVIGTENYGKTFGVTLDLAGHKIERNATTSDKAIIELRRWSELTINDSVGSGAILGSLKGSNDIALISSIANSELTINGGYYEWQRCSIAPTL